MSTRAQKPRVLASGRKSCAAFTLIELLIVCVISGVLFTAMAAFTRTGLTATQVVQSQNLASQTARTALARLMREAALAKFVASAQPTQLAFICTDITGDGDDDAVTYSWDADSQILTRMLNEEAAETFAEHVTSFALEYQYETEQQVSIASPGTSLSMVLGRFTGASGFDAAVDLWSNSYALQTFNNLVEVPAANSITVRAKSIVWPAIGSTTVRLISSTGTSVATGTLQRSKLRTWYQDITVPLTWLAGSGTTMKPGTSYWIYILPESGSYYSATIQYRQTDADLGDGLTFGTSTNWWGSRASMYFTLLGNLPVTTPTRATTSVSVLKTVKATIQVADGQETVQFSRTCKVLNQ